MEILIAVLSSTALSSLIQFFINRHDSKKNVKGKLDTFNKVKPDGWAMTYTAPWCAASVSAWAIKCFGATSGTATNRSNWRCLTL